MSNTMKKSLKKHLPFLLMLLFVFSFLATEAYLTKKVNKDVVFIVGDVDVSLEIYFEDENGEKIEGIFDYIGYYPEDEEGNSQGEFTKRGVIKVNISDVNAENFAENLRVDLVVRSNVDAYVRIAPYEQLTLTYTSGGVTREVAVVQKEYTDFNYQVDTNGGKYYDNRQKDGFIYYKEKVKKGESDEYITIPLIADYYVDKDFSTSDEIYSLQIGFIVESVQYLNGAQKNWGLDTTPWGTEW